MKDIDLSEIRKKIIEDIKYCMYVEGEELTEAEVTKMAKEKIQSVCNRMVDVNNVITEQEMQEAIDLVNDVKRLKYCLAFEGSEIGEINIDIDKMFDFIKDIDLNSERGTELKRDEETKVKNIKDMFNKLCYSKSKRMGLVSSEKMKEILIYYKNSKENLEERKRNNEKLKKFYGQFSREYDDLDIEECYIIEPKLKEYGENIERYESNLRFQEEHEKIANNNKKEKEEAMEDVESLREIEESTEKPNKSQETLVSESTQTTKVENDQQENEALDLENMSQEQLLQLEREQNDKIKDLDNEINQIKEEERQETLKRLKVKISTCKQKEEELGKLKALRDQKNSEKSVRESNEQEESK